MKFKNPKVFKHSIEEQSHCAATAGPPLWPENGPGREEHKAILPSTLHINTVTVVLYTITINTINHYKISISKYKSAVLRQ